jgi:hypothetical protein
MALTRIKRVRSHSGYARFLADTSAKPIGEIPRQRDIPSPYASGPNHLVYNWRGRPIITVETAHRCYDVFEVPIGAVLPVGSTERTMRQSWAEPVISKESANG